MDGPGGATMRRMAALAAVAMAVLAVVPVLSALAVDDANAPSAASVLTAVIAHGVAPMPAGSIAWRVVQDTAEPLGQAEFEARALGFAVATNDALLLTDQVTGARDRIAAREAAFTADQTMQMRESLGADTTTYDRIALVPADKANDAGGDTLLFAGDAFAAPSGERVISLVKGNIYANGHDDNFKTENGVLGLVLVLQGKIEVTPKGGDPVTMKAGEAGNFTGLVNLHSLSGTGAGATYVAALIGPAMPEATAPVQPTAAPGDAGSGDAGGVEIDFGVGQCPAGDDFSGKTPGQAGFDCVTPDGTAESGSLLAGAVVSVMNADTGEVTTATTDDTGQVSFTRLPAGSYGAAVEGVAAARGACIKPEPGVQGGDDLGDIIHGPAIPLSDGERIHCVIDTLSTPPAAGNGGSSATEINFSVGACPADATFSGKPPGAAGEGSCNEADGTVDSGEWYADATITLTDLDTGDTVSGQTDRDGMASFTDLPAGSYTAAIDGVADARSRCTVPDPAVQGGHELGDIVADPNGIAVAEGASVYCVVDSIRA